MCRFCSNAGVANLQTPQIPGSLEPGVHGCVLYFSYLSQLHQSWTPGNLLLLSVKAVGHAVYAGENTLLIFEVQICYMQYGCSPV